MICARFINARTTFMKLTALLGKCMKFLSHVNWQASQKPSNEKVNKFVILNYGHKANVCYMNELI